MNNFTYLENSDGGEVGVNGAEEKVYSLTW